MLQYPQTQIILKPCSHRHLSKCYGVSAKVLKRWLQPYNEVRRFGKTNYTLEQIVFIIEKIGPPVHTLS